MPNLPEKMSLIERFKFVVLELNKLFKTDYNMLSLDSMSRVEILELICKLLTELEVMNRVSVNNDSINQAVLEILQALKLIKYEPEIKKDPVEFRNGLAMISRTVIHPLLFWLLSNQNQVKKRAYIARYVEKVEVPPEIIQDPQMGQLYVNYEAVIKQFWRLYESNNLHRRNAADTNELQQDIKKMSADMVNLNHLLQKQREKVDNIINKEAMMVSVKTYLQASKQYKKLDQQLLEHRDVLKKMEKEIRAMRDIVTRKRITSPATMNPIRILTEDLHINQMLAGTKLPEEKVEIKGKIEVFEMVVTEPEPLEEDLDELTRGIEHFNKKIKTLVEQKMEITSASSDKLGPFRNQATIIGNKKQELSGKVVVLKSKVDNIIEVMETKKNMLHSLVGGEVLHGDELKQFIAKLRERSVSYKEYRARLQSLTRELAVLSRTFDILLLKNPNMVEVMDAKLTPDRGTILEEISDFAEIKIRCKKLAQDVGIERIDAVRIRQEFSELKTLMENTAETYDDIKKEFSRATGFITDTVSQLDMEKENMEKNIKQKEEEWKSLNMEFEKYELTLMKLGEDLINSAEGEDVPTMQEKLIEVVHTERKREEMIKLEVANMDKMKKENESQLEFVQKIILMLKK